MPALPLSWPFGAGSTAPRPSKRQARLQAKADARSHKRDEHRRSLVVAPWLALGVMLAMWPRPAQGGEPLPPAALERGRGRTARAPSEITPVGWRDVLWRTLREFQADQITLVAGSVAFSGIIALFPALAAFVSLYGMFADVSAAREHLAALTGFIPADALTFIGEQMVRIAAQKQASLSVTFIGGLLLSLWTANGAMKALFAGLNIAYDEREKRNFFQLNLITLGFTLGGVIFMVVAAGSVIVLPIVLQFFWLDRLTILLTNLRWPALLVVTMLALAIIYRYGPSRQRARWKWVTWGGAVASVLWLLTSLAFSWYLSNFANYNATYGSLGAIFGLLTWIYLSATIVLFGAELNSEIEHQTAVDSTTGAPKPLGQRGAVMADSVGPAKRGGPLAYVPDFVARQMRGQKPAPAPPAKSLTPNQLKRAAKPAET